jgi:hypothetical protein
VICPSTISTWRPSAFIDFHSGDWTETHRYKYSETLQRHRIPQKVDVSWRIEKFGLGMIFLSAHGCPPRKGYEDRQLNYQPP